MKTEFERTINGYHAIQTGIIKSRHLFEDFKDLQTPFNTSVKKKKKISKFEYQTMLKNSPACYGSDVNYTYREIE